MIEYLTKSGHPDKQHTACVVIPLFKGRKLSQPGEALDTVSGGALKRFLKRGDIDGDPGESAWLYDLEQMACDRILLIGCGAERDIDAAAYTRICTATAQLLNRSGAVDAVSYLSFIDNKYFDQTRLVRDTVIHFEHALYRFDEFKSKPEKVRKPLKRLTISVPSRKDLSSGEQAMREGMGIALGVKLARDLANLPPNVCNPNYLASRATQLQKTYPKLNVTIVEEVEMAQLGMGAFLSVSRGSKQPGKLICMQYNGAPESNCQPIVLVGKGITFDTGGISIKPSPAMDEMKYDMGGAASVFGTMVAAVDTQLPVNLVGIVAAAENMPDGDASRPGDIVTTLSGQTVEILNTDAEGR
ncbi:MAG TPA: leucyl aminopeptidase, partial [Gammaproteobacteria bacterium]|nr:leucyl aminopeptidase [Gammaproteobacteria bacterium]